MRKLLLLTLLLTYGCSDAAVHQTEAHASCKLYLETLLSVPSNAKWSSVNDVKETLDGWKWQGWVETPLKKIPFTCLVNGKDKRTSTVTLLP